MSVLSVLLLTVDSALPDAAAAAGAAVPLPRVSAAAKPTRPSAAVPLTCAAAPLAEVPFPAAAAAAAKSSEWSFEGAPAPAATEP